MSGAAAGSFAAVLQAARLETHAEKLKAEGYSEVADLMDAPDEDLLADIGLKKPELRRLRTALTAAGPGGAAGAAGGADTVLLPDGRRLEVCRAWASMCHLAYPIKRGVVVWGCSGAGRAHGFFWDGHIPSRREACVAAPGVQPPAMITLASFWQVSAVVIGRGGGGVVQLGRLWPTAAAAGPASPPPTEVAVKLLGGGATAGERAAFLKEVQKNDVIVSANCQGVARMIASAQTDGPDGRVYLVSLRLCRTRPSGFLPSPPLPACTPAVPLLPRLLLFSRALSILRKWGSLTTTALRHATGDAALQGQPRQPACAAAAADYNRGAWLSPTGAHPAASACVHPSVHLRQRPSAGDSVSHRLRRRCSGRWPRCTRPVLRCST